MGKTRSPPKGSRRASIAWKRAVLPAILTAIVLAPFLIQFIPAGGEDEELSEQGVPELVQKAVLHYNVSTLLLSEDYGSARVEGIGESVADAMKTAEQLQSLRDSLDWETPSGGDGSLLTTLARALVTYHHIANASTYYYNSSQLSAGLQESLAEMLEYLRECRVDEALEKWTLVRGTLNEALELIRWGLREALSASPDDMLSPDHRETYAEGLLRAQGHYVTLRTIAELMNLAALYREALEQACQSPQPPIPGLGEALSSMEERMRDASGPLAYEAYSTIQSLQALFAGQGGQGQGESPSAPGTGGGQGAGRGEPESDD